MEKKEIIALYKVKKKEEQMFNEYIFYLKNHNKHTNLVGKSTLFNPWKSHILDSIQITCFAKDRKKSILDMGTGAGLPGIVFSIIGYKNVTLVDSNNKKIKFLKLIKKKLNLKFNLILSRLENINNTKFDIITCRALARLDMLFSYSQKFIKKNTVLIFLKGKTVNDEILEAKKKWSFKFEKHQSFSDTRGSVLVVSEIKKI